MNQKSPMLIRKSLSPSISCRNTLKSVELGFTIRYVSIKPHPENPLSPSVFFLILPFRS